MSTSMKVLAAAALLAMATPALAQDASPWDLRDRNAYVLDMQGKMWSKPQTTATWSMAMMTRTPPYRRGTVLFMNNGRLYMASRGMFDRAGNFMAGGSVIPGQPACRSSTAALRGGRLLALRHTQAYRTDMT